MTTLTLGQAAKLAGVGKTTLTRAIKSGRLSADRRDDGSYRIDPAELARVYAVKPATPATGCETDHVVHRATPERDPDVTARLAAAEAEIRGLREMLARADADRDAWRSAAESASATVRQITDQRDRPSWWRRLTG